jgi:CubicO group peptidase (beta-lactamase class C family)
MRRLLALALLLAAPLASAQDLSIGVTLEGTLNPDSRDVYSLATHAGWYVYGHVNQLTVDVVVRILDPEGEEVAQFDSPARGYEPFHFSPDAEGVYSVEVTPFEGAEGDYVVELIANEPKATEPVARVDQMMTPFSGQDRPGAVISVLEDGEVVMARGYGMANLTHGVPMTDTTGMSIASVSKHFTAMAILLLEQEGKLSLDDDVRRHIPELKDFGTPVTLRHLLNHTSGYREILNFLPITGSQATDAMDRMEPIRVVQRQARLQNEPGAEYNYNNTAFMLLATVVERVSGQGFREFMEERVFRPLGMDDTTIKIYQGQVIPNSSQGYTNAEGGGFRAVTDFASAYGASGVNSTARDMTKWMLNFRDETVGGPEAIGKLTTRAILTSGDTTGYALGLGVRTWRGQRLYTHTGGETSHRTWFGYFPEIRSGLFFSSNNPAFSLGMWEDLAEAFFGEHLEPKEEEPAAGPDDSTAHATPSAEQLEAIAGTWSFVGAPLMIEYTVQDGRLFAQATGQPRFRVDPTSDSTFMFVGVEASVTFHFEADGSVSRATHHQNGDTPLEKVTEPSLTPEQLLAFEGRYWSDELETLYTLTVEDSVLTAHHRRLEPFGLTHRTGDEFSGGMWFFGTVRFDRDPTGAVSGFLASNGRTRDIWFARLR